MLLAKNWKWYHLVEEFSILRIRMTKDKEEHLLKPNRYSGSLTIAGEAHPVSFSAEAGCDNRCCIALDPIEKHTYLLLHQHFGRTGTRQELFELTGTADNGDTFASNSVSISGFGANNDGFHATLSLQEATVSVGLPEEIQRPVLRRFFRGFRSYRNSVLHTPLGDVLVSGSEKSLSPDEVSGDVAVQAPAGFQGEDWKERAEAFLSHMHIGLSFAHGGRLQTPRVDFISGNRWHTTFHAGSGFKAEMALQHFLYHDPFIKALVEGYFNNGPLHEGFVTALGWLQLPTTFDEVRFISAMTALEVIVDTQLPRAEKGGMMKTSDFRALRDKLNQTIDDVPGVSSEAKAILKAKIEDANKKVLSQKIDALFERLAIPRRDFDSDTVKRLTKVRNEIVHRGIIPDATDIWTEIILIRELINRILMGAIGFAGRYCCYIGGEHERTFPDLNDFPPKES